MNVFSELIIKFGVLAIVIVVIGLCYKAFVFPIKDEDSPYFEEIKENLKLFILSVIIFECSALYFANHFDFDWWQDYFNVSAALLIITFSVALTSLVGILIFGFVSAFPTIAWFRARKVIPTDVWVDFDKY